MGWDGMIWMGGWDDAMVWDGIGWVWGRVGWDDMGLDGMGGWDAAM